MSLSTVSTPRQVRGPLPWVQLVCAVAATAALAACNRNASTDSGNQSTQASTGTANSRGSSGESSPVPATGTGGVSDKTGATAGSGTPGLIGSSGGVGTSMVGSGSGGNSGASSTSVTAPALGTVSGGPSQPPTGSSGAASGARAGAGVGAAEGSASQRRVMPDPRVGGGSGSPNSSGGPATAGTFGITANGQPGTSDDRRGAQGPAGNNATTLAAASPGSPQLASGDKNFLVTAATSGLFEVDASQLAAALAASTEVKGYAMLLVNHHTQANQDLAELVKAHGIALPAQLPQDLQAELRQLSQRSGPAFDKGYVQQVGVKAHEKDISAFEAARRNVRDPQLKAWVEKTLPVLQGHLEAARKLARSTGV